MVLLGRSQERIFYYLFGIVFLVEFGLFVALLNISNDARSALDNSFLRSSVDSLPDKESRSVPDGEPPVGPRAVAFNFSRFKPTKAKPAPKNSQQQPRWHPPTVDIPFKALILDAPVAEPDFNVETVSISECKLNSSDVLRSLQRAQTTECRRRIKLVGCALEKNLLFADHLPRSCPLQDNTGGKFVGCFSDVHKDRDFELLLPASAHTMTPLLCIALCHKIGFKAAGLQYGGECWCGNNYGKHGRLPNTMCNMSCHGDNSYMCGGYLASSVYVTGINERVTYVPPPVTMGDLKEQELRQSPIRIAYVLTVTGRAVRQIRRLIKALYNRRHYFLIHVDAREEYLQRELETDVDKFPENMRVAKGRFSTIWGGASLMAMLLSCMRELLAEWPEANWDYFINLSESDFPIRTEDDLVAYLTRYRTFNFVKTHGENTYKFVEKQAVWKTFVECDQHMWLVGDRKSPDGIRIDGGSDWLCLTKRFVKYLAEKPDTLVRGLTHYFSYSLLPGESFFHTVLQNSRFCEFFANNNLHVINWVRKRGCKCQHKAVVDWCGCSPNDFMVADFRRLMTEASSRPVYFARKFEYIVSQRVVDMIENELYGSYPAETSGLDEFWLNQWHHLDKRLRVNNAYETHYLAFSRMAVRSSFLARRSSRCTNYDNLELLEVTILNRADRFHGLLVLFRLLAPDDGHSMDVEVLMQPQAHPVYHEEILQYPPLNSLATVEVGSDFDAKELIFRNYGSILGPWNEVCLRHEWQHGFMPSLVNRKDFLNVSWFDPTGRHVGDSSVHVEEWEYAGCSPLGLERPLKPGLWRVVLQVGPAGDGSNGGSEVNDSAVRLKPGEKIAELQFLIAPLTHFNRMPIDSIDESKRHNGMLDQVENSPAAKLHQNLLAYTDSLLERFWQVSDICVVTRPTAPSQSHCSRQLVACPSTTWSSRTADVKSEIRPEWLDSQTGRMRRVGG